MRNSAPVDARYFRVLINSRKIDSWLLTAIASSNLGSLLVCSKLLSPVKHKRPALRRRSGLLDRLDGVPSPARAQSEHHNQAVTSDQQDQVVTSGPATRTNDQ